MTTFLKCKMCGGDIEVNEDMTVGTCMFCGSIMTLPRIDSEKKIRLFNRANDYRIRCEFDKAYVAYQSIVEEDEQEAEAYWGMVLSEYGVEYVEDPATKKRIPTCHRTSTKPIQLTTNYEYACKYANSENRMMYQDEAEELDRIQKKALSISLKEDPYDVFICYKESDKTSGERTQESLIGQEIYEELTKKGLKVFFSRISLAEKLGKDYEPYIFSALRSARVMIVIACTNENVNSVWVKNEWFRYLTFMQDDHEKVMIPVYKNMETFELPNELIRFQGQDYSKIGALQDLSFAVSKLFSTEERKNKENAIEELIREKKEREQRENEQKVLKEKRKKNIKKVVTVMSCIAILAICVTAGIFIYKRFILPDRIYKAGINALENGEYEKAMDNFRQLVDYRDSAKYYAEAETELKEKIYKAATALYEEGKYTEASGMYESISEYRDSASMIDECDIQRQVEELGILLNESKEGDIIKWGDTQWIIIEKTGVTCVAFSKEKYMKSSYCNYKGNPETRYTWNNSRIKELLNTDYYEQGLNEAIKRRIRYDEEYDCNVRIIDIEEYTNNMDLLNSKISAVYWILDIDNDNDKYGLTRTVTFYGGKKDSIEKKYKTTSLPIYPVVTLSLN